VVCCPHSARHPMCRHPSDRRSRRELYFTPVRAPCALPPVNGSSAGCGSTAASATAPANRRAHRVGLDAGRADQDGRPAIEAEVLMQSLMAMEERESGIVRDEISLCALASGGLRIGTARSSPLRPFLNPQPISDPAAQAYL
jgi:hypothetical protein